MSLKLIKAIDAEDIPKVTELLEDKENHNVNFNGGISRNDGRPLIPLHRAVETRNRALVELLIAECALINEESEHWAQTPLHVAASTYQPDLIHLLWLNGADLNAKNYINATPYDLVKGYELHIPENRATAEMLYYLALHEKFLQKVSQGDLRAVSTMLSTTYKDLFFYDGSCSLFKLNPAEDTGVHYPALHCAVFWTEPDMLRLLLSLESIDPEQVYTPTGNTALHLSVELDKYAHFRMLVETSENLDIANNQDRTALDMAVELNRVKYAKVLLKNGATRRPAVNAKSQEMENLLERHFKKRGIQFSQGPNKKARLSPTAILGDLSNLNLDNDENAEPNSSKKQKLN